MGIAHVADLDTIPNAEQRAKCERRVLKCGRRLMLEAGGLNIEAVVAMAEELRA